MKNNKKKKIILGSCVGLALVSLCSVGFATWLVGMNKESATAEITNIKFDAVSSQTKYVDIAGATEDTLTIVDNSVTTNPDGNNNIILEGTSKKDLDVTLAKFELAYSSEGKFENLELSASIDGVDTGLPVYPVKENDIFGRTADPNTNYYYIELDKFSETSTAAYTETTITYDSTAKLKSDFDANTEPIEGFEYYKIKDTSKTLIFTWGNMFEGKAPIEYYQDKLDKATDIAKKLKMLNAIDQELTAMNEAFKNKTIKITVTLDVTFTTPAQ